MAKPFQKLVRPGVRLLKALGRSYRYEVLNGEIDSAVYRRGEVPIYCSWHQRWFAGITFMPGRHPIAIMVSQSQDGDFISEMITRLGWHAARGSSSRGGSKALRELVGCLRRGIAVGHIVDGPRGPFGEVKPDPGPGFGHAHRSHGHLAREEVGFQKLGPIHDPQALLQSDHPLRRPGLRAQKVG